MFSASHSTKSLSNRFHKNGDNSLLWQWSAVENAENKPKLTLGLFLEREREEREVGRGGIKIWLYRESKAPNSRMQIVFHGASKNKGVHEDVQSKPTNVNLNFKGWRGVWIAYSEFRGNDFPLKRVNKVEFIVKRPSQINSTSIFSNFPSTKLTLRLVIE